MTFNGLKNEEKMRKMIVKWPLLAKNGTERLKVINFELFFYNQKNGVTTCKALIFNEL